MGPGYSRPLTLLHSDCQLLCSTTSDNLVNAWKRYKTSDMWIGRLKVFMVIFGLMCIACCSLLLYLHVNTSASVKMMTCTSLWNTEEVNLMTFSEVAELYHGYVNSLQAYCGNRKRVGHLGDGGWDVCLDPPYQLTSSCIVYSFGIDNDWSFDDGMALEYGCEVYSFDPSMTDVEEHDRKKKIHFRRTGINGTDGVNEKGWRMRTFSSILKENGHSDTVIDVLKIDVEYSEWFVFPEMIKSRSLRNVKQLCFEIHLHKPYSSKEMYLKGLQMLKDIYDAGFRIFHTNRNPGTIFHPKTQGIYRLTRAGCHELCLLKDVSYISR